MKVCTAIILLLALLLTAATCTTAGQSNAGGQLEKSFAQPPDSARPWVYWFWLNGNVTREGITADLEAMKRVGIGGVLIMDVDQGTPKGPMAFGHPEWRAVFNFAVTEAHRLGLQINMTNDAGWCGSGGPWITPAQSMQRLVWTETTVHGPIHFNGVLPQPDTVANYYHDVAVLAFPSPGAYRIADIDGKSDLVRRDIATQTQWQRLPVDQTIPRGRVVDLTADFTALQRSEGKTLESRKGPTINIRHALWGPVGDATHTRDVTQQVQETLDQGFGVGFGGFHVGDLASNGGDPAPNVLKTLTVEYDLDGKPLTATATDPEWIVFDPAAKRRGDAHFVWDVPAGDCTILRLGHTSTGVVNHPAPQPGLGLETDKLSREATDAMFNGLMAKLIADAGPFAGTSLVRTHIDSWETGSQNWTPLFREDFKRLRGYDPLPFLPVMTGRVVDCLEVSERFLWDVRQTISDLLNTNYAGRMAELAHKHGIGLSIEAYGDCPTDDLAYGGRADEPMGESCSWPLAPFSSVLAEMASSAHTYGKPILGMEAFTSTDDEKWLYHPAIRKAQGDSFLCQGVNRFVIHRYAMQPWADVKPGIAMGPWGLHYERTQTWWEDSRPWHQYLARCQYLLRQGHFVADICFMQAERSPQAFELPASYSHGSTLRPPYNCDGCTPEVVLNRMTVKNGRLVLPDGLSYRVLVLPDSKTMTPRLLRRIKELVEAGATVIGDPPVKSPSLTGYPACDSDVKKLADDLWASGKIITGKTVEQVMALKGVPPDFQSDAHLDYIHRKAGGVDIYFVANENKGGVNAICEFRVTGRKPELWHPDTGRIEQVAGYDVTGVTRIPMHLEASGSVFVIFRKLDRGTDRVVSLSRNGADLYHRKPAAITVRRALWGPAGDAARTKDVTAQVRKIVKTSADTFLVSDLASEGDPSPRVVKTLTVEYEMNGRPLTTAATDPERIFFDHTNDLDPAILVERTANAHLTADIREPGAYSVKLKSGKTAHFQVPDWNKWIAVSGPWEVTFAPKLGAPPKVVFDKLISWSDSDDPGVKYFSGHAVYRKTIVVPEDALAKNHRVYLDLGQVEVIARVKLNGRDLGYLWKPPYRVEVTGDLRPGPNALEAQVVNLWPNRMIGDEQLPEDSPRQSDGATVAEWPKWLQAGKPSPTGRYTFTTWRLWHKDSQLLPSGLIGPVTLQTTVEIPVK